MKIDLNKNNYKTYLLVGFVILILVIFFIYSIIPKKSTSEKRQEVAVEFAGSAIGASSVTYSSKDNEFIVISPTELTESEKNEIKKTILDKLDKTDSGDLAKDGKQIKVTFAVENSNSSSFPANNKNNFVNPNDKSWDLNEDEIDYVFEP